MKNIMSSNNNNKPILNLINRNPNGIPDRGINDFEPTHTHTDFEPTYHRRGSVSNSHFYDVIGNESFFDSEPTIIDALRYLVHKCCCCCKCTCFDQKPIYHSHGKNWDYSIEDEVEKAMAEREQNKLIKDVGMYDLGTAFLDHSKSGNGNRYALNGSPNKDWSKSSESEPAPRFFKKDKNYARMRCYCIPCLTYKPRIWQLNTVTLVLQFLIFIIMGTVDMITDEAQHHRSRVSLGTLIGVMWFFQLMIVIQLMLICVKKLWELTFYEIMQLYITSIVMFSGVYATAYFYDNDEKKLLGAFEAFNLKETAFRNVNFGQRLIAFLYFSCSQQTLCGVCEIIPKSPPTQILAAVQMLFGIFFSIIIISIGISRVGEDLEQRHKESEQMKVDDQSLIVTETCWHALTHNKKIITFRRTLRHYLFLIVVIIQMSKNLAEWVTTDTKFAEQNQEWHAVIYIVFDVLNILVVIVTSLKFLHIGHMTELKLSSLCQIYLSAILIFTGVFVDLQVSDTKGNYNDGAFLTGEDTYPGMWAIFLYFSFAIMTLCGAGLDIKPKTSYAAIAVCIEMLVGLFLHVYIFGTGLLLLANKKFKRNRKEQQQRERRDSIVVGGGNNDSIKIDIENNAIGHNSNIANDVKGSELIMLTLLQE